jgi:hypothetical protein
LDRYGAALDCSIWTRSRESIEITASAMLQAVPAP